MVVRPGLVVSALTEPVAPVSRRWLWSYSLAYFGFAAVDWGASSVLTPALVSRVDEAHKVTLLGGITATWGVVGLVCTPIFGGLSDRTVSPRGRRHPWILTGTLGTAATLVAMSVQTEITGLLVLAPFGAVFPLMVSTGLAAVVPDDVPVEQRAMVSAWSRGVATLTGMVFGTALVSVVITGITEAYLVGAVLLLALTMPFALFTRGVPLRAEERPRRSWWPLWAIPRGRPDFAWALGVLFCHHLANALATMFLYFLLEDAVRHPDPAAALLALTAIYVTAASVIGVLAGRLSDRRLCRKKVTITGAVFQCLACSALAVSQTWPAAIIAAVLLGCGFGMFSAAGCALITELLPSASARAKDLGVLNVAGAAAGSVASVIAPPVINGLGSYPVLYTTAAVLAALSIALLRQIRSVS